MNRSFIYSFVSTKVLYNFLLRSNIFFLTFLFIHSPNSYSQSLTAEQIYKKVSGAVVVVLAYNDNDELASQGSGVVLNDKGYVVTNYHVLSGNSSLKILHGNEIVPYVDIIGIDVEKDILILKIEANKFPAIKIGDSKSLNIGQRVYAIGSPMGLENSISEGIISGLRSVDELKRNFIQITASISPGSSGGAIVNSKGELIGISTLTAKEGQNLNFAIPIEDVLSVKIGSYSKNNGYKDFELFEKGNDALINGDYRQAIKFYSRYIEKYPNDENAYNGRGIAKGNLEDNNGAIQDFNKAIELNPNYAGAYNCRGHKKSDLKDHIGAIQDYNKVIELDPDNYLVYNNRGVEKSKLEDYRGAIIDFNKAIEHYANYAFLYINRGKAKNGLRDFSSAIQDYNYAIEFDPNDGSGYYYRGVTKSNLEDYRGAIEDLNKALEINPKSASAFYYCGIAKYQLGDIDGACLNWSKAGELGDSDSYDLIRKYCK